MSGPPRMPEMPQWQGGNSAVMARVASFLPQLQAANASLECEASNLQVDLDLASDHSDDDKESSNGLSGGNGSEDENNECDDPEENESAKPPTIQFTLAVGEIGDHPVLNMMQDKDDEGDNEKTPKEEAFEDDEEEEEDKPASHLVVGNLLARKRASTDPLQDNGPAKRRGPLITEMD